MSKTMKAVCKMADGKENWEYKDVPRLDPGEGEVEMEVKCIGICGSELHAYHDNHFYRPGNIIGHEFCGVISRVGPGVTDWKLGDRVVSEMFQGGCGTCEFCRRGMPGFCLHGKYVGWDIDGGWADYFIAKTNMLMKLPDHVSYEYGAMIEPLGVLTNSLIVNEQPVKGGDVVLVQGCGTIGMIGAMVAKAAGASRVIMTGTNVDKEVRFPIAEDIKAIDRIVNVQTEDLKSIIMEETDGLGVDVILEASGSDIAINQMTDYIRDRGKIVALGESGKTPISIDWNKFLKKSCSIHYSFSEVHEAWHITMNLLNAGVLELDKLITHKLHLKDFMEGFELLDAKKGQKVLLYPQGVK